MIFRQKNKLLDDKVFDVKLITVPIVRKNTLRQVVFNEAKKFSLEVDDDTIIDYQIVKKTKDSYKIVVFIATINEILPNANCITSYQILQKVTRNYSITDYDIAKENTRDNKLYFVVPSIAAKLSRGVNFVYLFQNGEFVSRNIYFENDWGTFNTDRIFWTDIFETKITVCEQIKNVKVIKKSVLDQARNSIKTGVFRRSKNNVQRRPLLVSIIFIAVLIGVISANVFRISKQVGELQQKVGIIDKLLLKNKGNMGSLQNKYETYTKIMSRKSKMNLFFYSLYGVAKDNVRIKRLSCSKGDFSIEGECKNDQKLENNFRNNPLWEGVSFSFIRENKKINFVIRGKFQYE